MSLRSFRSRQFTPFILAAVVAAPVLLAPSTLVSQEPAAPAQARPASHTVKRGDTLWDIAKLYLGDPFLWPEIYRLNTDVIEDPHWIYPGETLKLPTETQRVVAAAPVEPAPAPAPTPVPPQVRGVAPAPAPAPVAPATTAADTMLRLEEAPAPVPTVRSGEFIAAPWVDRFGGPRGSGFVMGDRDVPGIESADRSRLNLYDQVLVSPPDGPVAERSLYLTYRFGPQLEDVGQVIIPTGVIRITRPGRNGEAAIGQVVKLFSQMEQGQHLIPLDSSAAIGFDKPRAVPNGVTGTVRWIYESPVLPSLQDYVLLDITRQNVQTGDQVELFMPRQGPGDGRDLAIPELRVATAQILRATPFGATAIILHLSQPKIQEGTAARVTAKMP
jgi:LysM repeat protein